MEFIAEQHPEPINHFLFKVEGLDDPLRILSVYQLVVKDAVETPGVLLMAGLVGSHSTRKLAATWGRSNGCNKVSNAFFAFANFHLLTHVCIFRMKLSKEAAGITQGVGPIAYAINLRHQVSNKWILDHLVPHMVEYGLAPQVCLVLGRAVLFALFDPVQSQHIPEHRRQQMMHAFNSLGERNTLPAGCWREPCYEESFSDCGTGCRGGDGYCGRRHGGGRRRDCSCCSQCGPWKPRGEVAVFLLYSFVMRWLTKGLSTSAN
jgi:hypothetical protein